MLENRNLGKANQTQKSILFYHLSTQVPCVPGGGHQIPISEAYWCGTCQWYIC